MLWFSGPILNAVEKVKSSNVVFLVFIRGDDKLSQVYETFLNKETQFESEKYLALKILHGSLAHSQFKAIYNHVPVPSVFLIDTNGIPLDVVCFSVTPDGLRSTIQEAISKHSTKSAKLLPCEDVKKDVNSESISATNDDSHTPVPPAIDCEEMYRRYGEIESSPRFMLLYEPDIPPPCLPVPAHPKPLSARIQFRLPSNEMPSWEFPDKSTLQDVRLYLMDKVKLNSGFKLVRTYPRTALTPEDECKTLSELNLTPSSTLIVVPVQDEAVQTKLRNIIAQPAGRIASLIILVFRPFFTMFDMFRNFWHNLPIGQQEPVEKPQDEAKVENMAHKKTSTTNIHGFTFEGDSDSEPDMNTDNGNSTQQK